MRVRRSNHDIPGQKGAWPWRAHTGMVPRTGEIAQLTAGVHSMTSVHVTGSKAVGSLPMASSSAACLVLTTSVHVLAGRGLLVICDICYPARRPGIHRACGRLLPLPSPLSACRARPLRWWARPAGYTRPPSQATVPAACGKEGGGILWDAVRVWGPFDRAHARCTAELSLCLYQERPGSGALAAVVVPSLAFAGWGLRPAGEQGEGGGILVQRTRDRLRRGGGGGHSDCILGRFFSLFLSFLPRPVRPLAVAEGSLSSLGDWWSLHSIRWEVSTCVWRDVSDSVAVSSLLGGHGLT